MPNPETSNMNKTRCCGKCKCKCQLLVPKNRCHNPTCPDCHSQGKPETWEEEFKFIDDDRKDAQVDFIRNQIEAARKEGILSVVEMIPDYLDTNTDSGGYDTEILKEEIKKGLL